MKRLKLFDLFCGTGGFSKGFEKSDNARYQTLLGVDILPVPVKTFSLNHPVALAIPGDIRRLRCDDLQGRLKMKRGELDLIIGGPPCQGFSSIRPFRSSDEDDPRNSLFEQFAIFVNFFRPRALVIENVVGLATHSDGSALAQMHERFASLGYDCDWRILNAAHFGVPQRRERLVFIGLQKGGKPVFPQPTHQSNGSTIGYHDRARMVVPEAGLFTPKLNLKPALSVLEAIDDLPPIKSGEAADHYLEVPRNDYQRQRRNGCKKLSLHYSTAHTPRMLEIIRYSGKNISAIPSHLISSGFSSCYSRLDGDIPSVTITVNFVHPASNRCIHPKCDRALTPREGARLQSFDDEFQFAGNRSQVVKQIGNAVPPLLGKAIGEALAEVL
jgi:DNA (cytosine-5)-methyltransferase 1